MHQSPGGPPRARRRRLGLFLLILTVVLTALPPAVAQTPTFAAGVPVGTNGSTMIWEASGLMASRQNPGVLWTHNDSGYRGSVFALSTNGALLGRYWVSNVYSGDFEDIALGPGPLPQFQYLYLGDIGDNFLARETVRVLRFPEPAAYGFQSNAPVEAAVFGAEEITLAYPDGRFNAESLMIDPLTGDLYVATKQTNECRVYRATQAELRSGPTVTLTWVASPDFRSASGGDISADGSLIAIRRPGRGGLWVREAGQTVAEALQAAPITIPVIGQPSEPNGESIAFERGGAGYFTISEGSAQPIYFFARTDSLPSRPRVFVASGADWEVNDFGEPLLPGWTTNLEASSQTAPAPLGSGGGEQTTLESPVPTVYFLHRFTNSNATITNLALSVSFTDGLAVYLNGTEIFRRHLVPGAAFDDFALASNAEEFRYWFTVPVDPDLLRAGTNVITAEVHRFEPEQPALHFDLQLLERPAALSAITSGQLAGEDFVGTVQGAAGLTVGIERSHDFVAWNLAAVVVLTNGLGTFTQPATNASTFYRVRQTLPP